MESTFIRNLHDDPELSKLIDCGISKTSLVDVFHRLNADIYSHTQFYSNMIAISKCIIEINK